jgi:hypothetical protein
MNTITKSITETITPEAIVEQLRTLREQIPEYAQLTTTRTANLQRAANVEPVFVQASINTIGTSQSLEGALGRPAETLRQEAADVGRWSAVEDELKALLKGVQSANLTRRHRVGLTALQTYRIAQQLVRRPEHADLLPHLAEMKRLNRFSRRVPAAVLKARAEAKAAADAKAPAATPVQPKPATAGAAPRAGGPGRAPGPLAYGFMRGSFCASSIDRYLNTPRGTVFGRTRDQKSSTNVIRRIFVSLPGSDRWSAFASSSDLYFVIGISPGPAAWRSCLRSKRTRPVRVGDVEARRSHP